MTEELHDPMQHVKQLRQTLAADKLAVGFFLGAGCPCAVSIAKDNDGRNIPLIPDIKGLTTKVREKLESSQDQVEPLKKLIAVLAQDGDPSPNIETILNRIRALREVAGKADARGLTFVELDALDQAVCGSIKQTVTCDLPGQDTPYHALAWFIANHRSPTSEIFTTNYDLLMEQALEACRAPYFDGFVGSSRPFFDQRAIEDDKIPVRWSRLWKLHGSVNWRFDKEKKSVFRSNENSDAGELLIHPSHRKYDESRRMPYFVMVDRLRNFMRNSDKPVALVIVGYSFGDEHINEVIVESLKANASAAVFALQYDRLEAYPHARALAESNPNLSLLARDAAIVRRKKASWMAESTTDIGALGSAFRLSPSADGKTAGSNDSDSPRPCDFLAGDFRIFGTFLNEFANYGTFLGRAEQ